MTRASYRVSSPATGISWQTVAFKVPVHPHPRRGTRVHDAGMLRGTVMHDSVSDMYAPYMPPAATLSDDVWRPQPGLRSELFNYYYELPSDGCTH